MKNNKWAALLLAAAMCTIIVGCTTSSPQEENSMPIVSPSAAISEKPSQSGFAGGGTGAVGSQSVPLANSDKLRITYQQGESNSVTCVTSADQLKQYEQYGSDKLAAYDNQFFDNKALVLVKYTVNSGSTQLTLDSATQVSSLVSVHVDAQSAGMGTSDMATWLLWAEVDKSLSDCQWVLDGASGTGTGVTE